LLFAPAIKRAALCTCPSQFEASCADADVAAAREIRMAAWNARLDGGMNHAMRAVKAEAAGGLLAAEIMAVV
jgi:hypothetical protein